MFRPTPPAFEDSSSTWKGMQKVYKGGVIIINRHSNMGHNMGSTCAKGNSMRSCDKGAQQQQVTDPMGSSTVIHFVLYNYAIDPIQ